MRNYWTADFHLFHANIIRHCNRPFESVKEMNSILTANWNSVVTRNDVVWHVGDFALSNGSRRVELERVLEALNSLNGHIMLIPGSHDQVLRRLPHSDRYDVTDPIVEMSVAGRRLVLCHYPLMRWPRSHHGSFHMYGHCHGQLQPSGRSWDCGVDAHEYRLWTEDEVVGRMESIERSVSDESQ